MSQRSAAEIRREIGAVEFQCNFVGTLAIKKITREYVAKLEVELAEAERREAERG